MFRAMHFHINEMKSNHKTLFIILMQHKIEMESVLLNVLNEPIEFIFIHQMDDFFSTRSLTQKAAQCD